MLMSVATSNTHLPVLRIRVSAVMAECSILVHHVNKTQYELNPCTVSW